MSDESSTTFYGFFPGQEPIEIFVERLENFLAENKVIADMEKVKFLLSSVGSKTYSTLKAILKPTKPISLPYQNLIKAMIDHYKENNEMAERFLFWKRDQFPNESIMDYVNELQRLAATCNFAMFLDQALRDRFVFGLCDKNIQNTLIDTRKLTFKKACTIAQAINIETCLTNEKPNVYEEPTDLTVELSVKHRSLRGRKPSRQKLGKRIPVVPSKAIKPCKSEGGSMIVKNEPTEESLVVSNFPEDQSEFAFEEIICKGYPAEEVEVPCCESPTESTVLCENAAPETLPNSHSSPKTNKKSKKGQVNVNIPEDVPNPQRPFACDLCPKSFGSQGNLARHRDAHSGERKFSCAECGKSYTQASSLKAHVLCHGGQRRFMCDRCDQTFIYRSNLRVHLETHDAARSHACPLCSNDYKGRRSLRRHLVTHGEAGKKIFDKMTEQIRQSRRREAPTSQPPVMTKCKVCDEEILAGRIRLHMRRHGKNVCTKCGKYFTLLANLKRHMANEHEGLRPFPCKVCKETFSSSPTLQAHQIAKHTDQRPFVCDVCGKGFVLKGKLKNHVKLHANLRDYICETCGKGFVTNAVLKAHLLSHGERTFVCSTCGKGFKTSLALNYHTRTHTGATTKRFTCEFCGQQFVHRVTLKEHTQRAHTTDSRERRYQCRLCDSAFYQNSHLKSHMYVHTRERKFDCDLCDRSFSLRGNLAGHMAVHTGERKFRCSACPKSFTLKRNLKSHVAKSHVLECVDSLSNYGDDKSPPVPAAALFLTI